MCTFNILTSPFFNFATFTKKKNSSAHVPTYQQPAQKDFATTFTNQYVSLCYEEQKLKISWIINLTVYITSNNLRRVSAIHFVHGVTILLENL